jgi:pimeloyl-ACP methyl ester carboxylesterase
MKQFYLTEIITKDKLIHQGLFFHPSRKATDGKLSKAILWVHGLMSTFHNNVTFFECIADVCEKEGVGFGAFNNRGHDIVTGIRKADPKSKKSYIMVNGGAGYERFEECIYDIDAGISFLADRGFTEIILAGHSTGANKVCYYGGAKKDKRVRGIVLLSPVSDRLDPTLDRGKIIQHIAEMQQRLDAGHGDELLSGIHAFPVTPRRFISLYAPHSTEDTFDYGDKQPALSYFSAIRVPTLVLIGSRDEHLDRPVGQFLDVFAKHARSKNHKSIIIPDALHGFNGKEREAAHALAGFITGL